MGDTVLVLEKMTFSEQLSFKDILPSSEHARALAQACYNRKLCAVLKNVQGNGITLTLSPAVRS